MIVYLLMSINTNEKDDTVIPGICIHLFVQTGAVEGMYFVKNASLVKLSEQQLIDCSSSFNNAGCSGGLEYYGYAYYKTKYPELGSNYPYQAVVSRNFPLWLLFTHYLNSDSSLFIIYCQTYASQGEKLKLY